MSAEPFASTDEISMSRRAWVGFLTVLHKEIIRFTRIWMQTILPSAITMSLYFLIFGKFIGSKISELDGVPYVTFIMPGLVMMAFITNSYGNVVSSFYGSKFQRQVEELLVSPMPNWAIVLGFTAGGVARGLCVGAVVTLVALFFTHVSVEHIFITLSIVILTATLFSLGGFINAIYAKSFDDVSIVPTFVLTPLTYLGGVFYSVNDLPDWAATISRANPILYMVNAFRYGIIGKSDIHVGVAFAVVIAFTVTLFFWALHLLNRGTGIRA